MTLLAPWYLAAGVAAALALVALHLLAVGRPPELRLPTARFVPERPARAVSRAPRPADRLLLLVRVLAALLAALAFARPARTPTRRAVARVVLADRSRTVADPGAVRRALDSLAQPGDVVIAFDDAAAAPAVVPADAAARAALLDSASTPRGARGARGAATRPRVGSLSAALAAARRHAPAMARGADSLELAIVSPLAAEEADAATAALRGAWGGRARVVRVDAAVDSLAAAAPEVRLVWHRAVPAALRDDALAAALALRGVGRADSARDAAPATERPEVSRTVSVRVVRDGVDSADVAWARDASHVLVDWPAAGPARGWVARPRPDTAGAVVAGGAALVAPLARPFAPADDALPGARVIARWADGEPAALERDEGAGCVRAVAVPLPQAGDLALSPAFARLLGTLTRACGAAGVPAGAVVRPTAAAGAPTADPALEARLAGRGPLLAARALLPDAPARDGRRDRLPAWLLGAALALLLAELPLRRVRARQGAGAPTTVTRGPAARAA